MRLRFPTQKSRREQRQEAQVGVLQAHINGLEQKLAHVQSTIGVAGDDGMTDRHYTLNQYRSYDTVITQISKMRNGRADWGGGILELVIAARAAFIIGPGLRVYLHPDYPDAQRELNFAKAFTEYNKLNEQTCLTWCQTAESHGKFLALLQPDPSYTSKKYRLSGMVKLIPKPYNTYSYTVYYDPDDHSRYLYVDYTGSNHQQQPLNPVPSLTKKLQKETGFAADEWDFVYATFSGQQSDVNEPYPIVGKVIDAMVNLDKAMWDWRKCNHLFASPTPVFTFEEAQDARKFFDSQQYQNWRIGKGIVLGGKGADLKLVESKGEGYTTLMDEIKTLARKISAETGIPVHFFSYPDLLSNRDTADSMIESVINNTNRERKTWASWYETAIRKAMMLSNEYFNTGLNPDAIQAQIVTTSSAHMTDVEKVWLPAYEKGAIGLKTLLRQLAVADPETEREEIKKDANLRQSLNGPMGQGQNPQAGGQQPARPNKAD